MYVALRALRWLGWVPVPHPVRRPGPEAFVRRVRALTVTTVSLFAGIGCARHVALQIPHTELASSYECRAGAGCKPSDTDVPAYTNRSRTTYLVLPSQCGRFISRILIQNAHSSNPVVRVDCATPEKPIGETSRSP